MIRLLLLMLALPALHAQVEFNTLKGDAKLTFGLSFYGKYSSSIFVKHITSGLTFCFGTSFTPDAKQDCFIIKSAATEVTYASTAPVIQAEVNAVLQGFPTSGTKKNMFSLTFGGQSATVSFYANGGKAAVIVAPVKGLTLDVEEIVNGESLSTQTISERTGLDFSSCRASDGSVLRLGKSAVINCKQESCKIDGSKSISILCGPDDVCINNQCQVKLSCTLTGPTVIDVKGRIATIKDRCRYSLLSSSFFTDLFVYATYTERGRKDVSFLDTIQIYVSGTGYFIEQGGAVKRGGNELNIPESGLTVGKLTLNKLESGVVAIISDRGYTVTISFDGIAAQIFIQGPGQKNLGLTRLCANARSSLGTVRISGSGCDKIYTQDPDPSIKCDTVMQQCNVLKTDQFSSCHSLINPVPFTQACAATLCKYPDDDKLICHYLESYNRACTLLFGKALTGWRDSFTCPSNPKMFCKDKTCHANEYCTGAHGGDGYQCNCKTSFAETYRATNKLSDGAVCEKDSGKASLINCLLVEKGIDYTTLHLNDKTCVGTLKDGMVNFEFSSSKMCNTVVKEEGNELVYENSIKTGTSSGLIVRQDEVNIPFKCSYTKPPVQRVSIRVTSSSVVTGLDAGGYRYTLQMATFSDEGLKTPLRSATLNQKVWVSLVTSLDGNVAAMVVESCWATKKSDPKSSPKYDLIKNSCPNAQDKTVTIQGNGEGSSSVFSFNIFQFSGSSTDVYLHCEVKLCSKTGKSCVPTCPASRRRRSVDFMSGSPALISMSWTS